MVWIIFSTNYSLYRGKKLYNNTLINIIFKWYQIHYNINFLKDIYIVTVPIAYGPYDAEIQKRLIRAEKKKILEDLKEDETFKTGNS